MLRSFASRDKPSSFDGVGCVDDMLLLAESHSFRSAPAQKARPLPVTMAHRREGSLSNQL